MKPKTFCLITPWMALGGADRCGLDLIKLFSKQGYRTVVIATRHDIKWHGKRDEFEAISDKVYLSKEFETILSIEAPEIIVVNNSTDAYGQLPIIRQSAKNAHISCLVHMILPKPWDFENHIKRYRTSIDSVISISKKLKNDLVSFGIERDLITPIHWFGFEDTFKCPTGDRSNNQIICPFRLHQQKRPEFVADIAYQLRKNVTDAKFQFLGGGIEKSSILARAKELGVTDMLTFAGVHDFEAMPQFYANAKALLCPSRDEGIPLAYFEAMQCSIPLAVSNVGAVSEAVPSEYLIDLYCQNEASNYAKLLTEHLTPKIGFEP